MISKITFDTKEVKIDFSKPISIARPIASDKPSVKAWGVDHIDVNPVRDGDFIGDIAKGSSVNFKNLSVNPHGNGTHTECVGHIIEGDYFIGECLKQHIFLAQLISVSPIVKGDDFQITRELLEAKISTQTLKAIIIRTLPNDLEKLNFNYTGTNPAYFTKGAIDYLNSIGVEHLLVDLPSVDKEQDSGRLEAHKLFWGVPGKIYDHKTITELVYVPNKIVDGSYVLQLAVPLMNIDAALSNPILYFEL